MATIKDPEIYAIIVHLTNGKSLEGYVERGADTESGFWLVISRTQDLNSASYVNRSLITHFDLSEI